MSAIALLAATTGKDAVSNWLRTDLVVIIMSISGGHVLMRLVAFLADHNWCAPCRCAWRIAMGHQLLRYCSCHHFSVAAPQFAIFGTGVLGVNRRCWARFWRAANGG